MNFKTDTKEKFRVLSPQFENFTENLAVELFDLLTKVKPSQNTIVNMEKVVSGDDKALEILAKNKETMMVDGLSYVLCCIQKPLMQRFISLELDDMLNYAPTESEAWDIVQMEEIERELLNGEN